MTDRSDFFIGWQETAPQRDRRFLLTASAALLAGAAAAGWGLGGAQTPTGDGVWEQGQTRIIAGLFRAAPYPHLVTRELDSVLRCVFLVADGKTAIRFDPALDGYLVEVYGTLIQRGTNSMLAVDRFAALADETVPPVLARRPRSRGKVFFAGEIVDAKCWFGAMRPGYGIAHRSCAVLCARGGLPLAFCRAGRCGDSDPAPILADENGRAHAGSIAALVGRPVTVDGELFDMAGTAQLRVARDLIRLL